MYSYLGRLGKSCEFSSNTHMDPRKSLLEMHHEEYTSNVKIVYRQSDVPHTFQEVLYFTFSLLSVYLTKCQKNQIWRISIKFFRHDMKNYGHWDFWGVLGDLFTICRAQFDYKILAWQWKILINFSQVT